MISARNSVVKNRLRINLFLVIIAIIFFPGQSSASISNISINPDLDIAHFNPYKISADITGSPTSVSVEISGINSDDSVGAWNYYVDGTPDSDTRIKSVELAEGTWESENIYPDDIYPEIFFAPSEVTWNNVPSNISTRRNNYHLFHFDNPFTMVGNMSFFVEVNAEPVSTLNSADLSVYLVRKNKGIAFFNSDWRNKNSDVELLGTIGKDRVFHHTHVAGKSSHHLIPITANPDGTVGINNLDISGDFWIVLYSNSPNVNRGWNLKYHNSSICGNSNRWYIGNQSGWQTASQGGCPDVHIHIARRGENSDGVRATVSANYSDSEPIIQSSEFYFEPLPNLPPIPASFTSPVSGGKYAENLTIEWGESSDPNGDFLRYSIYLLDSGGEQIGSALVSGTAENSFLWDVSAIDDGEYGLKGVVCDDDATPLCSTFYLSSNFTILKSSLIYSLSNLSMSSNNSNDNTLAKSGDVVTLSFAPSDEEIDNLQVEFYSGGITVNSSVNVLSSGDLWTASYVVSDDDEEGTVSFVVLADNLDLEYSQTSDDSYVSVYKEEAQSEAGEISEIESSEESTSQPKRATVLSWKSYRYEKVDNWCVERLKIKIRGRNFNKNTEVKIGKIKASSVKKNSSREIVADFCLEKLLSEKTNLKRSVSVQNPNTNAKKAGKKIDLGIFIETNSENFSSRSSEGVKNTQKALSSLGYLEKQYITGFYGTITTDAVRNFQKDNGIFPVGFTGPLTRAKLADKIKQSRIILR
jgi:hypothetical protein